MFVPRAVPGEQLTAKIHKLESGVVARCPLHLCGWLLQHVWLSGNHVVMCRQRDWTQTRSARALAACGAAALPTLCRLRRLHRAEHGVRGAVAGQARTGGVWAPSALLSGSAGSPHRYKTMPTCQQVVELMRRIGKVPGIDSLMLEPVGCSEPYRYRNKMTFTCSTSLSALEKKNRAQLGEAPTVGGCLLGRPANLSGLSSSR